MSFNEIIGNKIILKPVSLLDVTDEYVSWLNDKEVSHFLATIKQPYTKKMLFDYITAVVNDSSNCMFMIIDKVSGKSIGTIKLSNIDKINGVCNLGIMIGNKNYWGGGLGKEALRLVIEIGRAHV